MIKAQQLGLVDFQVRIMEDPGLSASLDTLSSRDAAGGLRAALSQGIDTAVAQLGTHNGFLNDPKVTIKLAARYDEYAGKAAGLGLIKAQDANLDDYVTAKALDGLFSRIADEEKAIRKDPLGQTSSLIKKVFSAVR
jgi:hypothetical protein